MAASVAAACVVAHAECQTAWAALLSQPSGPGLLKGVVLILVTRFSTELPAMVVCRHRVGKCQSQHRGLFRRIVRTP